MYLTIFSSHLLFLQRVEIPIIATKQLSSPKHTVIARVMTKVCPLTCENSTIIDRRTKEEEEVTAPTICRWEEAYEIIFNFHELL